MAEIQLNNVSKRFPDGTEAVKDISLTVADGEFFILLGPSGCGKSTLLNMIVGLDSISEGEILVDGRLVNNLDPRERNMAMVFQSYAIYPHMSVQENLAFPLKISGMQKEEIKRRVKRAADVLELGELLKRMPRSLSGGQRQRVAMGRAIVREPDVFLLDEPLSNLDAKLRSQMRNEIARLQEQLKTTMIYVTHDQTEAITLGHRLAVLRRGKLQQVGTPRDLYNNPANLFVAGFIGSPAMNLLPGRIEKDKLLLPGTRKSFDLPAIINKDSSKNVIVGLRPEHLAVIDDDVSLLSATTTMVEWLGADAFVHFELDATDEGKTPSLPDELDRKISKNGKIQGIVRLDPSYQIDRGDSLYLKPDTNNLHLFNPEDGICLNRSPDKR
ncbi:MAG: sn-glycerol-3-phosphate ABC transporter ATP-binding protein UgpC [Desulforhopalus sp.]